MLVNVSSFRLIIGFALSFNATSWVEQLGFLQSFAVYSGALALLALGLPLVYIYGKRIRAFTAGKLVNPGGGGAGYGVDGKGDGGSEGNLATVVGEEDDISGGKFSPRDDGLFRVESTKANSPGWPADVRR